MGYADKVIDLVNKIGDFFKEVMDAVAAFAKAIYAKKWDFIE